MKKEEKIKGFVGWLGFFTILFIIFTIYFGFTPIIFIIAFIKDSTLLLNMNLLFEVPVFLLLSVILIYSWYLIFKKSKRAPILMILSVWIINIMLCMEQLSIRYKNNTLDIITIITYLLISLIAPVIWTLYFTKSKRVKNTFIKK